MNIGEEQEIVQAPEPLMPGQTPQPELVPVELPEPEAVPVEEPEKVGAS